MAASFTPLQPTLGIAHGDLRLVCCCSVMETHFRRTVLVLTLLPDALSREKKMQLFFFKANIPSIIHNLHGAEMFFVAVYSQFPAILCLPFRVVMIPGVEAQNMYK